MDTVPQELIDYIIDYLHGDKLSLSHTSTVSKSWLPASSFHLFASFTLRLRYPFHDEFRLNSCAEIDTVLDLISHTPRISSYIQHLSIMCRDFVAPACPFDTYILGRLIEPIHRLEQLTLHGLNLYSTIPVYGALSRLNLTRLTIEDSRLSSDALHALFRFFKHIDQVQFTRILSVDCPLSMPASTPGPASLLLTIPVEAANVSYLVYASCSRTQLSALLSPLVASISLENVLSLKFTNLLLDDMRAVDEYLAVLGPSIGHLHLELPDRWFSWDPPETNIEKLAQYIRLPSFARLASLETLHIAAPIKMCPTAEHVNRFMWTRTIDLLLTLPPTPSLISTPLSWSSSLPRRPSGRLPSPLDSGVSPNPIILCQLESLRLAMGNPRWTALAEVPYILGVLRSLDWTRFDEVVSHLGLDTLPSRTAKPNPATNAYHISQEMLNMRHSRTTSRRSGVRGIIRRANPIEFVIGCPSARRSEVECDVLENLSTRARTVVGFTPCDAGILAE